MTYIVEDDQTRADTLRMVLGPSWRTVASVEALRRQLAHDLEAHTVVVGADVAEQDAFDLAQSLRVTRPDVGVVLIRRYIETSVLAEALRSGVREVVEERDLDALHDAVRRTATIAYALRDQAEIRADSVPTGRMITVFAAKGGCGKTTLATNLAAALADGGRREVCLVDLDLAFGDVAIALQLFPAHTLADAVPLSDNLDEAAVAGLVTPHSRGLSTLVAPVEPGLAETIPAKTIAAVLHVLKQMYAYVVVDTPPAFTDHVLAAFDESEIVALMATLDIPALKNLKLTLETLDLLNYPRDRWRVVLNRADSKVGLALSEVEKTLRMPISAHIPSSRNVPASINRGVPIVLDSPNHPVSVAVRQFAETHVVSASIGGPIPRQLRSDRRGMRRRRTRS